MPSAYPGALDTLATNKSDSTVSQTDHAAHHNDLADAVNKVEAELGVNPSGSHATVAAAVQAQLSRWMPIFDAHVNLSAAAAATYPAHRAVTEDLAIGAASPAGFTVAYMYLDPADYAIAGFTLRYRLIMSYSQNAVSNSALSTLTAGLYPYVGAGATTTWAATLGAVVAGSTAALAAGQPAASAEGRVVSSTFNAPAANTYAMAVVVGTVASAGATRLNCRLEYSYA